MRTPLIYVHSKKENKVRAAVPRHRYIVYKTLIAWYLAPPHLPSRSIAVLALITSLHERDGWHGVPNAPDSPPCKPSACTSANSSAHESNPMTK